MFLELAWFAIFSLMAVALARSPREDSEEEDGSEFQVVLSFPEQDPIAFRFYARQAVSIWSHSEIDYGKDKIDYQEATPAEKHLIDTALAFFLPADNAINKNLRERFIPEAESLEQERVFDIQKFIENEHAMAYSNAAITFKGTEWDAKEIVNAALGKHYLQGKLGFMNQWTTSRRPKYQRLTAFACAERIFFCTLFASVFFFRSKGKFKSFVHANELIARDETIHGDWNAYLVQRELQKMTLEERKNALQEIEKIVEHASRIEEDFAEVLLPEAVEEFSAEELKIYAHLMVDQLLSLLGCPTKYNVENPFTWMDAINHQQKSNTFDLRSGSYSSLSVDDFVDWRRRAGQVEDTVDPYQETAKVQF